MKTALLIIDIQNDYFEDGTMTLVNAESASKNVQLVLEKFRKEHLPVIHIQHIATKPNATFFLPNTFGVEIHKNVQPLLNEKIIIKHFPNSFRETELLSFLRENQIKDLVICGMMTHMCVDATTRAANDFGLNCTLISDGCATKDLEINSEKVKAIDVQNSFLAALNTTYARVISTKTLLYTQNGFFQ
ncbi:MAG: cysteine hydrolase family protein [Paludibacter sp.]|nr:cysteine hydrolase family protein [Paludibacter sp.]